MKLWKNRGCQIPALLAASESNWLAAEVYPTTTHQIKESNSPEQTWTTECILYTKYVYVYIYWILTQKLSFRIQGTLLSGEPK